MSREKNNSKDEWKILSLFGFGFKINYVLWLFLWYFWDCWKFEYYIWWRWGIFVNLGVWYGIMVMLNR